MMNSFMSCPAFFNYRFNLNKVAVLRAKPLDKGGLVHVGLENYYQGLKDNLPYDAAVDKAMVATRVAAATDSDLDTHEVERVFEVLLEYFPRWRIVDMGWQIGEIEKSFIKILYEDETFRLVVIGKVDLTISNNQYTNVPVDHKTYERDFPVTRLGMQFPTYAWATNSQWLFVNRVGFQTSIKPEIKHKRVPLSFDSEFIEQWKQNWIKWAMRYYDCIESNDWPMNTTSCFSFGRLCEYHEVCDTSGTNEQKEHKLHLHFKTDKPWDVSRILSHKG